MQPLTEVSFCPHSLDFGQVATVWGNFFGGNMDSQKICQFCGIVFLKNPEWTLNYWDKVKYHSNICYWKSMIGKKRQPLSNEWKIKISKSKKGCKPWNTGKKRPPMSLEWRAKIAEKSYGKKQSLETIRKRTETRKKNTTEEKRIQWGLVHKGSKCNFWKGGITEKNLLIRESIQYKLWREKIFMRDDYTCQFCDIRGGKLNADHIRPFSLFPELRFELSNGRTLCVECHRKTNTYGSKISNKKLQLEMI